jgi:hypothetical protein
MTKLVQQYRKQVDLPGARIVIKAVIPAVRCPLKTPGINRAIKGGRHVIGCGQIGARDAVGQRGGVPGVRDRSARKVAMGGVRPRLTQHGLCGQAREGVELAADPDRDAALQRPSPDVSGKLEGI